MTSVPLQMLLTLASGRTATGTALLDECGLIVEYRFGRRAGAWTYSHGQYRFTPTRSFNPTLMTSDLFEAAEAAEAAAGTTIHLLLRRR